MLIIVKISGTDMYVFWRERRPASAARFASGAVPPALAAMSFRCAGQITIHTLKAIKNVVVASIICLVLLAGVYFILDKSGHFSGRSLYIHVGVIFGTMMALNVWMVIWPSQKKIIAATAAGTAPDANLVALAGLRSRQNTYMSVPLLFTMISNHYPTMYGGQYRDICLASVIAIGFAIVWWLYKKSGGSAPASY